MAPHCARFTTKRVLADVALPHLEFDASLDCQFPAESAMVRAGRTQAVCLLKRGFRENVFPTLQEYWSRGCRRARVPFSHFAWWPLWQHVQRKKKKLYLWKSRFRPSRPITANTSKSLRRATWGNPTRHAAFFGRDRTSALAALRVMQYNAAVPFSQDRSLC